jgi:drug/metabolite transporter (DMT)-like permease
MRIAALLALLAASLFGAATPLSKMLLDSIGPFSLAGLLYLGAGLSLAPFALRGGFARKMRSLSRGNARLVAGSTLCGGLAGPVLMLFGLKAAKSASVSLYLNLELVATALLGHFIFKDKMTRASAASALGILTAAALLSIEGGRSGLLGALLVGAACLAWGLDNHFTALNDGLSPQEGTFIKGVAAGTCNLAIGFAVSERPPMALPPVALALGIGALSYGLSIVLYIASAQGLGASRAQLFFSSSPVFGLAIAALALGETFSPAQVIAFLVMLLSYALLMTERHGHGHRHEAKAHTHWHRHGEGHHDHGHERLGLMARLFGHSHEHNHEALDHAHAHVSDIHHRHEHADGDA